MVHSKKNTGLENKKPTFLGCNPEQIYAAFIEFSKINDLFQKCQTYSHRIHEISQNFLDMVFSRPFDLFLNRSNNICSLYHVYKQIFILYPNQSEQQSMTIRLLKNEVKALAKMEGTYHSLLPVVRKL